MKVEVVRSHRRRRTVQATEVEEGVLRLSIPASMTKAEEEHWVQVMKRRFERRRKADRIDLEERARKLAARYELPVPTSIRWVDNQQQRWGSCTPADGSIRISSRLAGFPLFVLDGVLVHEMAHLAELHHNERFKWLINRYPLMERATGYLMAKGMTE